ncbi:D-amino acid aminotransferase [Halorhodospira abdelmalekii]|uniref:aminotransferase class IV n=1 Tax=Halorhodospira abdelmalekii TaxID=421629 RepID=UPI001908AE6F|nr:aminotransferase class IV [Halorhodospira abdelmalekii]MBK1734021.1 D-amino acid aminotransferase [Halorhodospira abdelmalekii]
MSPDTAPPTVDDRQVADLCYLNGGFVPLAEARLSPLDRGFLFGDGVYEVIPVYAGTPFRLADHLQRLRHSLHAVRIADPLEPEQWQIVLEQLCREHGGGDLVLYVQVTRGAPAMRRHEFPDPRETPPTVFATASPLPSTADLVTRGVRACTLADTRWSRCDIKSTALLANVLLRQEANERGATEAILHRDGWLTEGAASTLFLLIDGQLLTPRLHPGLLPGVTRQVVLELAAAHGLPYACRDLPLEALADASEVWLSSSTKAIIPVITIDDIPIGDGKPGATFRTMHDWFEQLRQGG